MSYTCDHCGLGFQTVEQFEEHISRAPTTCNAIKCRLCCEKFKTEEQKQIHIIQKHNQATPQDHSSQALEKGPCTPTKRKDIESPSITPLNRLHTENNYSDENDTTPHHITPIKRKSLTITDIESPLKRLNIDESSPNIAPDTFKKPIPPSGTPRGRKKQLKTFTLE